MNAARKMNWVTATLAALLLSGGLVIAIGVAEAGESPAVATPADGPASRDSEAGLHAHHHDAMTMPAADVVPGDSLYQLPITLHTSEGASLPLATLRGKPLLVTMFYSQCTSVCPLLTSHLQHLAAAIPPAERQRLQVLMVSLDSVRDTPEALQAFRQSRHLDAAWTVAQASAADVRALAAALGIRYRELADHSFNHTALIALADRDGTVRAQSVGVAPPEAAFMHALHAQLAGYPNGHPAGHQPSGE